MEAETLQVRDMSKERLEAVAIYLLWQSKLSGGEKSASRACENDVCRREHVLTFKMRCERSLLGIEPQQDSPPVTHTTHRFDVFDGLPKQGKTLVEDQSGVGLAVGLQIDIGTGDVAVKRTVQPRGSSCRHPTRKTDAHPAYDRKCLW